MRLGDADGEGVLETDGDGDWHPVPGQHPSRPERGAINKQAIEVVA